MQLKKPQLNSLTITKNALYSRKTGHQKIPVKPEMTYCCQLHIAYCQLIYSSQ